MAPELVAAQKREHESNGGPPAAKRLKLGVDGVNEEDTKALAAGGDVSVDTATEPPERVKGLAPIKSELVPTARRIAEILVLR